MTTNDITVKMAYNQVNLCNSTYSTITNRHEESNATSLKAEILGYLPEGTLARKIFAEMKYTLSPKQTWVIAYELMKSEAFKQSLVNYLHETYGEDIEACDLPSYEC